MVTQQFNTDISCQRRGAARPNRRTPQTGTGAGIDISVPQSSRIRLYWERCGSRGQGVAKPLRIFISSPGDVTPERRRAALVIEKLGKVYARFFAIELILWEVEPMLASGHFQDNITPPSATDIFILIVWSRLGTPL